MADDLVPIDPDASFLDKLNLPHLIAGPAGEAISKLIGGAVDIPAAWFQQVAQRIRDKTEARTVVSKAIADEAASLACSDPELVRRAAHSLLSKELRHQIAKEAIALRTIDILEEEAKSTPEGNPPPPEHKVDDDWLNVFARYAEDASSGRLQELWARVLAGQIRKPQSFSLHTLRFIAELDAQSASLFEKYAARVVFGDFLPFPPKEGPEFKDLLTLEEIGMLNLSAGHLRKTFELNPGPFVFPYKMGAMLVANTKKQSVIINATLLTGVGREVFQIVKVNADVHDVRRFADKFPKNGIKRIMWLGDVTPPLNLWEAQPDRPSDDPTSPTG